MSYPYGMILIGKGLFELGQSATVSIWGTVLLRGWFR
jgi:hypothetical protein